jgi:hypothetical protein
MVTSIESSNRLPNTVLSKPYVLHKVHQVYHVLDGAISLAVNGEPGIVVRCGESVFLPAGTRISLEFLDRYVRFWSYSSGNGLETLISEAGGAFDGKVVPDHAREFDIMKVQGVAKSLDMNIST